MSLHRLLARVESCYKDEDLVGRSSEWEEEGRKFKLECRSNKAGRFLFCSVVTEEAKRFSLIFHEERGTSKGVGLY